jgi:hypothetical protein
MSSESLARVGLPTALAPMQVSKIRFDAPVGAIGRTKAQPLGCIGRDRRMHETNGGCIVLTLVRQFAK